jgi:hypothetical protein
MMIRRLFPFLLLLLVSDCSAQSLTLVSQPATQLASSTAETSIAVAAATPVLTRQSFQEVAFAGDGNTMFNLDSYKWKNRLLLVFAPSEESAAYKKQMQLIEGKKAGFDDRDLLVVKLLAEGTSRLGSQPIDEATATQLRSRFKVGQEEFRVILVGKDGTEKRRDSVSVEPKVIFNEIDAMPMRQEEMRSKE